jgi:hypothetical protein
LLSQDDDVAHRRAGQYDSRAVAHPA